MNSKSNKNTHFKNFQLLDFVTVKIAKYAREFQETLGFSSLAATVYELEQQARTMLRIELTQWPELSKEVTAEFIHLLQNSLALSIFERSMIILVELDARQVSEAIQPIYLTEFTRLKWEALGACLKGGVYE